MINNLNKQRFVINHSGDTYYYNDGGYQEFAELPNLQLETVQKAAKKIAKQYLNMEHSQRAVSVETIINGEIYCLRAARDHKQPTTWDVDRASLEFVMTVAEYKNL